MYSWRISKYDPNYRNKDGAFLADDWSSFSEIGNMFNHQQLTLSNYLSVENLFVDAVFEFIKLLKISSLEVESLEYKDEISNIDIEKYQAIYPNEMINLLQSVENGDILNLVQVEYLTRLILREHLWCKLKSNSLLFVHFGYDYYVYIGSKFKSQDVINKITNSGLFVEDFESPYSESL